MHVVVIGGGHNGLVAAATLAGKGHRATVLERRDRFGGVADGLLHDTETLSPDVVSELDLTSHGLQLQDPSPVFVPSSTGSGIMVHRNPDQMVEELGPDLPEIGRAAGRGRV